MPKKRNYEIRVHRRYDEDYVDLVIVAHSAKQAKKLAVKEAAAEPNLYFAGQPNPTYEADDPEED